MTVKNVMVTCYKMSVCVMTKEEQIEELVEWIIESMDVGALENYATQQLEYIKGDD